MNAERADEHRKKLDGITRKVIGCAYEVSNSLGAGFLEKVNENALAHEIRKAGLHVEQQRSIRVQYDGIIVGDFVADLLVEEAVLIELKAAKALEEIHYVQCMNYLKATGLKVCLLLNFGTPKIQIKRVVHRY